MVFSITSARSNIGVNKDPQVAVNYNTSIAAARESRQNTGIDTGKPSGVGLNQSGGGNSVPKSYRKFSELVNVDTYDQTTAQYEGLATDESKALRDYETKVQNGAAADNAAQFQQSYADLIAYNTLKEFYQQQTLFWKSEKVYIANDENNLTQPRELAYKKVQELEKQYEAAILSGNQVESARIKGDLNAWVYQLQKTQTA